jgi:hypothetical protein
VSAAGVDRLRRLGPAAVFDRSWVLFNKILPEFASSLGSFLEIARYLSPIPWDADVIRAFVRRRLAIDPKNGNAYTVVVADIAEALFPEMEVEVARWRDRLESRMRRPVVQQLRMIERERMVVAHEFAEIEVRLRSRQRLMLVTTTAVMLMLGMGIGAIAFTNGLVRSLDLNLIALLVGGISVVVAVAAITASFGEAGVRLGGRERKTSRQASLDLLEARMRKLDEDEAKYRAILSADVGVRLHEKNSDTRIGQPG